MEHLINSTKTTTDFQNLMGDIADFICLIFNLKITPDFQKIEKKWYESENWVLNGQIYYRVDDQVISAEIFDEICKVIADPKSWKHTEIWDIRKEKSQALYANALKENKTIAHINHILREIP